MFVPSDYEIECAKNNIGVDVNILKNDWDKKVNDVFIEATLPSPKGKVRPIHAGKQGLHTEHLQTYFKRNAVFTKNLSRL